MKKTTSQQVTYSSSLSLQIKIYLGGQKKKAEKMFIWINYQRDLYR